MKLHKIVPFFSKAKQPNIEELLSKADQLVSEQPEPEAAVYEAMADSLGAAWKDLNRQLQLRANLLENSVNFYNWAKKVIFDRNVLYRYGGQRQTILKWSTADKPMGEYLTAAALTTGFVVVTLRTVLIVDHW